MKKMKENERFLALILGGLSVLFALIYCAKDMAETRVLGVRGSDIASFETY